MPKTRELQSSLRYWHLERIHHLWPQQRQGQRERRHVAEREMMRHLEDVLDAVCSLHAHSSTEQRDALNTPTPPSTPPTPPSRAQSSIDYSPLQPATPVSPLASPSTPPAAAAQPYAATPPACPSRPHFAADWAERAAHATNPALSRLHEEHQVQGVGDACSRLAESALRLAG